MNPDGNMADFFGLRTTRFLAAVSGIFSLVVIIGLLWFGLGFRPSVRLDEERVAPKRNGIRLDPGNSDLIENYRKEDVLRREQYFSSRWRLTTGARLLFVSLFVFALSLRRLSVLNASLPLPVRRGEGPDEEKERRRAIVSVLVVSVPVVAATFLGISWARHEEKPPEPVAAQGVVIVEAESVPDHLKWPSFRGPTRQGIAPEMTLPLSWDAAKGENILWKTKVPLPGHSSPIVWGERVFLTGADKEARKVFCVDRLSGQTKWECAVRSRAVLGEDFEPYEDTGLAASTPVTDGTRVYALFGTGELAAVDFSGNQVWSIWFGQPESSYGLASSPLVHDGKLILQLDQASRKKGKSFLYAIDPATGDTLWKTPREVPSSWSSPIVVRMGEREEIITCADPFVIAYDPASGKELWRAKALHGGEVAPLPVYADGVVHVVQEGTALSAIRIGGSGDVTKTHVAWTLDEGLSDCASPITDGKLLLMAAAGYGAITCVDVKTGKKVWQQDFDNMFWSSPTLVGHRVYWTDVPGKTYVFELSDTYKPLGKGDIGERVYATPAFVDSRIYMRGKDHLYCIGMKE